MMDLCKSLREELALEEERMLTNVQQEHLEKCTDCQRFLASLHAIDRGLESLPEHDASDFQVRSVLRRLRAPRISRFRIFVPAAAAAFLAVFVFLWMPLYRGQKSFDREAEVADRRISRFQGELVSTEESRQEEPGTNLATWTPSVMSRVDRLRPLRRHRPRVLRMVPAARTVVSLESSEATSEANEVSRSTTRTMWWLGARKARGGSWRTRVKRRTCPLRLDLLMKRPR